MTRDRLDLLFFFFQAEDGIRDYKVTGVQTCALPISSPVISCASAAATSGTRACRSPSVRPTRSPGSRTCPTRSEERRVGKEGMAGGGGDDGKEEEKRCVGEGGEDREEAGRCETRVEG